jgi:hypothetical protein
MAALMRVETVNDLDEGKRREEPDQNFAARLLLFGVWTSAFDRSVTTRQPSAPHHAPS